uniref:RNA-directed DNA polymerase, eukaryota, reverse transcriptase zinc-binding domain protein n=1 Tax=Tanacetum cinerariifolium TaxID=118510 RepID=A0A699IE10_TANCI|nr:RNA-directed DNA polymerase, eukaryota, reverse transcriptase zinc-binding domain protein [Tanacetum cinerariifolium]
MSIEARSSILCRLVKLDKLYDQGKGNDDLVNERTTLLKELQGVNASSSLDMAQKAKIHWSIKGDENSKYFHGIVNKERSQLAIRGILIEGDWIDEPAKVKNEFLKHFSDRFYIPNCSKISLVSQMPKILTLLQKEDLERSVNYDEIKRAVTDKDMVKAVEELFVSSKFLPGSNSSFITFIPKTQDAKMVKDFALLILDGLFILNELLSWCKFKKTKAMIFKVDFKKAFDSVRWDFLDDTLDKFSFGTKWRGWIQGCLNSAMGSILVNGSPTSEFKFHKGLKQRDTLSPFLFILVMESLHLSFNHILNAGLFKGILIDNSLTLSHLFYAEDVVFIEEVNFAASLIGCTTLSTPFNYLGVKVGAPSFRNSSWEEVLSKISYRLSKWKLKALSIGGRLTLLKSELFNGVNNKERKISMIRWKKVMASKKKGGLNVSSFFTLNRALLFKWLWRFISHDSFLWSRFIKVMYGVRGSLDNPGDFSVTSANTLIDDSFLPSVGNETRWVNFIPIKINVFAWKVCLDKLPTRFNLSLHGLDIPSILCPICHSAGESSSHLFFSCNVARLLQSKVARWWDLVVLDIHSYDDWLSWFSSLRLVKGLKDVLEGIFYVML